MWLASEASVSVRRESRAMDALTLAFALARGYSARRSASASFGERLARVLATPLLVLVLYRRVAKGVWKSSHLRRRFVRSTGWLLGLVVSWCVGEAIGTLNGAGETDAQWR